MKHKEVKQSSGITKLYKEARRQKLPLVLEAKRKRIITRLNKYGLHGELSESIKVLRKRLHQFTKTPKLTNEPSGELIHESN